MAAYYAQPVCRPEGEEGIDLGNAKTKAGVDVICRLKKSAPFLRVLPLWMYLQGFRKLAAAPRTFFRQAVRRRRI
jgi:hypothetical protein